MRWHGAVLCRRGERRLLDEGEGLVSVPPLGSSAGSPSPSSTVPPPGEPGRPRRQRAEWMDLLRGLAAVLVVLSHALVLPEAYADVPTPSWVFRVYELLSPYRIPTLVLLSGMLLAGSLAKGRRRFFAGKLENIGWPYLVWAVVFGALSWPLWSVPGFLLGGSYLWFLLFLLVFYAAAWLLRRVPPGAVVLVAFTGSILAPDGSKHLERPLHLFAVFMLGHLLATHPRVWAWVTGSWWALAAAAALAAVHVASPLGYSYGPGSTLMTAAGVVFLARGAQAVSGLPALAPLRFAGRSSLVFYVVHYPVMAAVVEVATAVGLRQLGPLVALCSVVALSVGAAAALLRDRPWVSWLFAFPARGRPGAAGARPAPSSLPEG